MNWWVFSVAKSSAGEVGRVFVAGVRFVYATSRYLRKWQSEVAMTGRSYFLARTFDFLLKLIPGITK